MNVQIKEFVDRCGIMLEAQSGFRRDYSCSTALLKVTDDIFRATERGEVTALVLLEYSKAFDKINHNLLVVILNYLGFQRFASWCSTGIDIEAFAFLPLYITDSKLFKMLSSSFLCG